MPLFYNILLKSIFRYPILPEDIKSVPGRGCSIAAAVSPGISEPERPRSLANGNAYQIGYGWPGNQKRGSSIFLRLQSF